MSRLDALAVRESNGKSYFTKIGSAWPNKDGKGFNVLLDAIPASVEGQYKIMLREPLPKDRDTAHKDNLNRGQVTDNRNDGARDYRSDDLDDDPMW